MIQMVPDSGPRWWRELFAWTIGIILGQIWYWVYWRPKLEKAVERWLEKKRYRERMQLSGLKGRHEQ